MDWILNKNSLFPEIWLNKTILLSYFSVTNHNKSKRSDIFYCYFTDNFLDISVIKCFGISTLLDSNLIISSAWACRFWKPVLKMLSTNYSRCFWSWLCIMENKIDFLNFCLLTFKKSLRFFKFLIFLLIKMRKIIIK